MSYSGGLGSVLENLACLLFSLSVFVVIVMV